MRVLVTGVEATMQNILFVANVLSNVEQQTNKNLSTSIAPYYKHTTEEKWWFKLDPVADVMGQYGKPVFGLLTGNIGDTDIPVVNPLVFEVIEVADDDELIALGYMEPLGE